MIVCTKNNIWFALIQQHINNHVAPSDMQRLAMKDLIVNRTSIVPWVLNQIRELEVSIEYDQSTMKTCPIWNVPLNAEVNPKRSVSNQRIVILSRSLNKGLFVWVRAPARLPQITRLSGININLVSARKYWSECIQRIRTRHAEHLSWLTKLARQIYVHMGNFIIIPLHWNPT